MKIETERLFLREMNEADYDALYSVLADSDIMQHYLYTFDEKTPFREIYSYMKGTNEASAKTAMAYGCRLTDEYMDVDNESAKVFRITKEEWKKKEIRQ